MPALFYHLLDSPLEEVATTLLTRALAQGWQIELRGRDPARMAWLDDRLWLGGDESFLPHGVAGGPHDALQPVLLTTSPQGAGRQAVMAIDGAQVAPEEIATHERIWILFDGHDTLAVERAREQWRELTAGGAAAQYWREENGRWEKKAQS